MRALLDAGASPWVENVYGLTPYERAAGAAPDVLAAFAGCKPAEGKADTGVWPLASFMNHASKTTTVRRIIGRSMLVYANRDLAAGEDLTTSYTSKTDLAAVWGIPNDS